jgi:hypothetical protein
MKQEEGIYRRKRAFIDVTNNNFNSLLIRDWLKIQI